GDQDHLALRRRWWRPSRMIAVVAVLFVFSCSCCVWSLFPTVGVGVSSQDARLPSVLGHLPPGASDVSYYLGGVGPASYVEFTVNEAAFLSWAAAKGWAVEEIDKPHDEGWGASHFRPEPFRTR